MSHQTEISIEGVSKSYGALEVIPNLTAKLEGGAFTVILGPSGCGKSTLLNMLAGLEEVSGGTILFGDREVQNLPAKDRGCAMVFQNYALYPHMSVADNMGYALKIARVKKTERDERIRKVAEIVGLGDLLDRRPGQLSGGQRQRVAIARAIVREPQVLLFDEPLSNLDAKLRHEMRMELARLHNRIGATSVFVTHDQVEAMTLADKILIINDGLIEQYASPDEIYHRPATTFVAGFIGSPAMNLLEVNGDQGALRLSDGSLIAQGDHQGSAIYGTRGQTPSARRVPWANFFLRGSFAVITLFAAQTLEPLRYFPGIEPGQALIFTHMIFNAMLLLTLPFLSRLEAPVSALLPDISTDGDGNEAWGDVSCLDTGGLASPTLALANMRREVLRMPQMLTAMAQPSLDLYREGDLERIAQIRDMDGLLNQALSGIRQYGVDLPFEKMSKQDRRLARSLTEMAVDLEAAGDIVSKQLLRFAKYVQSNNISFSEDGWAELAQLHSKVMENMTLAFGVVATDNAEIARQVVEEKGVTRLLESTSRKRHFKRLRQGDEQSFESSDMHLETLRALRELNSIVASIAYPLLMREGHLMENWPRKREHCL